MNLLKSILILTIPVLLLIVECIIFKMTWEYYVISAICGYCVGFLALKTLKETKWKK